MVTFNLELSVEEMSVVYQGVQELPFKKAEPVVLKIRKLIDDHNAALEKKADSERS